MRSGDVIAGGTVAVIRIGTLVMGPTPVLACTLSSVLESSLSWVQNEASLMAKTEEILNWKFPPRTRQPPPTPPSGGGWPGALVGVAGNAPFSIAILSIVS